MAHRWQRPLMLTLSSLLIGAPRVAMAQEATTVRVGAGPAFVHMDGSDWGGHALLGVSRPLASALALRGDVFLSLTRGAPRETNARTGADATLVLRRPGGGVTPYVGAGVGYTRTDFSPSEPLTYDLGASFVVGMEGLGGGNRWFVEARGRFFGNVFHERASTQSLFLVTVGRRW